MQLTPVVGKTIKDISFTDNDRILQFTFTDKTMLTLEYDQECCEHRYMHTDDSLQYFIGTILHGIEIRNGPNSTVGEPWTDDFAYQESQFLIVLTSLGQFTVVSYNENNGYYDSFDLSVVIS